MTSNRRAALIIVSGAGVIGQLLVLPALVVTWLGVYLVFFGEQPKVTAAATLHWALISGIAVVVSAGLIVVAALARVRGLVITHSALLLVIVGFALFFAVPRIDLHDLQPSQPLPSNYHPCYSGSNECN
ncbi:MAG: hypothetical protein JWN36_15 [Microbacteriaceae bacterium]|nr:hypothetical protein [Microbacteriaceae bacterium]